MPTIPIRLGNSIREEIETVYDDITKRAYEIFLGRGGACALDLEDWVAAESQLLSKPETDLTDMGRLFLIRIQLQTIDPSTLAVLATPDGVVMESSERRYPRVFRAIRFPQTVIAARVRAVFSNGKLFLIAPKSAVSESFEVGPASAATPMLHSARK
jgi:hypothetical protein